MTEFSDIVAGPGERNLVYGTTRSGKSCHIDWEAREIQASRPDAMQILLDTKPRFRAETERGINPKQRKNAAWRYRTWTSGPIIPGSVLVNLYDPHPFRGLWTRPGEIAIMQSGEETDWNQMLKILTAFTKAHLGDRERHIVVDEVLDFYGRTTWSINQKQDAFYRASRAGGERLIGLTLGAQRVHGLPIMIRNMFSRVTLYHLDEDKDMKYLNANGIKDAKSPKGDFIFKQWIKQKGGNVGDPLTGRLNLPNWYLDQLSAA